MKKFNIIIKCETFVDYIFTITEKAPKKLRTDLIPELRKRGCNVLQNIIEANLCDIVSEYDKRYSLQNKAKIELKMLDSFSELCMKHNYITSNQFENVTRYSFELFDSITKWIESDKSRIKSS